MLQTSFTWLLLSLLNYANALLWPQFELAVPSIPGPIDSSSAEVVHSSATQLYRIQTPSLDGRPTEWKPLVTCGPAPIIENAVIDDLSFPGDEDSLPNDYVWYHCVRGWTMNGNSSIQCQTTGEWSTLPQCVRLASRPTRTLIRNRRQRCSPSNASSTIFENGSCLYEDIRWTFDAKYQRCHVFYDCLKIAGVYAPNSFASKAECLRTCKRKTVRPVSNKRRRVLDISSHLQGLNIKRRTQKKATEATKSLAELANEMKHLKVKSNDQSSEFQRFFAHEEIKDQLPSEFLPAVLSKWLNISAKFLRHPEKIESKLNQLELSGGSTGSQCLPGVVIVKQHSSCLNDSHNLVETVPFPVMEPLKLHHLWYQLVKRIQGKAQTNRKDPIIIWNKEMALTAERHASQCLESHDDVIQRTVPSLGLNEDSGIGQNICWASWDESIKECVSEWGQKQVESRYPNSTFSEDIAKAFSKLNDSSLFTDIPEPPKATSETPEEDKLYIGCGKAHCEPSNGEWDYVIVCNYGPNRNNVFVQYGADEEVQSEGDLAELERDQSQDLKPIN